MKFLLGLFSLTLLVPIAVDAQSVSTSTPLIDEAPQSTSRVHAIERPHASNYLGLDFMGFAGFLRLNIGSYQLHYEHVFGRHHGIAIAGDFVHVHQNASHIQSHQWTFGGSATYRYYFGDGEGVFLGLNLGYRRGWGHIADALDPSPQVVMVSNEQFRALAQVGYRFYFPTAMLSLVPRVGIGYGPYTVNVDHAYEPAKAERSRLLARDTLGVQPVVIEFELSLAFAF